MSMMSELNYFLGLQIKQLKNDTFLNQSKYLSASKPDIMFSVMCARFQANPKAHTTMQ